MGKKVDGTNLFCNGCSKKVNLQLGYFRCKERTCDYDICQQCGLINGFDDEQELEDVPLEDATSPTSAEDEGPTESTPDAMIAKPVEVTDEQEDLEKLCPNKHALKLRN